MQTGQKKVLILGAGTGGIAVCARLRKLTKQLSLTLIEPASKHYYQPLWTLAAAGLARKEQTGKPMAQLIPKGVEWIQESVQSIDARAQLVRLSGGQQIEYDYLIIATGLRLDWGSIAGLEDNLGRNGIYSIYEYEHLDATAEAIETFSGGKAIFVMPPTPIKCAGAPQKIMYLADDLWRRRGIRAKADIHFKSAGKAMFGIPVFAEVLDRLVKERSICPHFQHQLIAVNAKEKQATFAVSSAEQKPSTIQVSYDFLHVVPKMKAHDFIADSDLAFQDGEHKAWLAVDKRTLQHHVYPNIFGIGDVTGIPNSKTGAAIRKQYPVVAQNLLDHIAKRPLSQSYNGYSSCPLITEVGKVMLAEFGYEGKLMPSFPLDPAKPRRSYWHLKRDVLPPFYWHGMMKGHI